MCSVAELLSECIRHFAHGSNVQLLKFYYKKTVKLQQQWYTYKGWHLCLYIYSNVPAAKSAIQHASKAEGWCKRWGWDLTVYLVVFFWRDVAVYAMHAYSNVLCDWSSVDHWLVNCDDQKDLSSVERSPPWSRWQQHTHTHTTLFTFWKGSTIIQPTAGPLKRPSQSTIASLQQVIFTSCYKSHRLQTCLRPQNVQVLVLTTRLLRHRSKFFYSCT